MQERQKKQKNAKKRKKTQKGKRDKKCKKKLKITENVFLTTKREQVCFISHNAMSTALLRDEIDAVAAATSLIVFPVITMLQFERSEFVHVGLGGLVSPLPLPVKMPVQELVAPMQ